MRLVPDSSDPGKGEAGDTRRSADDGAHRHHGCVATNFFMPETLKLPHWETHVRLTREWMRGETVLPEIAHLWPKGSIARLSLLGPDKAAPGEEIALRVVVENAKAGHNITTGPQDFMRAWVHLRAEDAAGRMIAEWGAIDPETRAILDSPGQIHVSGLARDQGTLVLEGVPLDAQGNELKRHELWRKAGGKGQRVIFPRYSDSQVYRFAVPEGASGPLVIRADFNFRRYRQEFLDLVVPQMERESGVFQPTVTQSSAEKRIELVSGEEEAS
jgi:hypothetical protein